jgi:hypothetical protein
MSAEKYSGLSGKYCKSLDCIGALFGVASGSLPAHRSGPMVAGRLAATK